MSKQKYIVGLGCSWTQGEGGYPDHIWQQYNGRPQKSLRGKCDYHLRAYEHENSWVNQLCRDHFPEYTPINLGVKGIGNYAAAHQLYFCDKVDWENSEGIIVFMLSGFERLDLFNQKLRYDDGKDDFYSNNEFMHHKWRTAWPFANGDSYWNCYAKDLWSEEFVSAWQMMALLDVQNFAKANGFKLVVANGFNQVCNGDIIEHLHEHVGSLVDKFNWQEHYIHNHTDYKAFVEKLVRMDNIMDPQHWQGFHQHYVNRDWPAEYLTNCEGAHPTIKGYKVIADELANFVKYKGYA